MPAAYGVHKVQGSVRRACLDRAGVRRAQEIISKLKSANSSAFTLGEVILINKIDDDLSNYRCSCGSLQKLEVIAKRLKIT